MAVSSILENIKKLTVVELSDLVKSIEVGFGVSAAAPVAVAAAGAPGADSAAAGDSEKSEYKVELVDSGAKKINVIKALRASIQGLGLKEAKELSDGAPCVINAAMPKEDANKLKAALEEAGAKVTLS